MSTVIRSELSKKNKYYISKHRYYELKHFCMQYYEWKKRHSELSCWGDSYIYQRSNKNRQISDKTAKIGSEKADLGYKMKLIEQACDESDSFLAPYIFKAVTEDRAYTYLKTVMEIPCGKDYYYARYRKFFWILDKKRR